jgi:hypothetical protein
MKRGPQMTSKLRELDRKFNGEKYPLLCYPELYLLEGGYKNFYEHFIDYCEPKHYVNMIHKDHKLEKKSSLKMH